MSKWETAVRFRAPKRKWFRYSDGTYYRNCSLIRSEHLEALTMMPSPRSDGIILQLEAEWDETFRRGIQHRSELGPRDVVVEQASRIEPHLFYPGLWDLCNIGPLDPPSAFTREQFPDWHWEPDKIGWSEPALGNFLKSFWINFWVFACIAVILTAVFA